MFPPLFVSIAIAFWLCIIINRPDIGVKQMINKFHTVNVAKWVECDSDEHNVALVS